MDRIETMKAFVTVAEEGSFTRAADKLALSNQLVSKYVTHFEAHLGVRLFNRTTRSVHLTEEGEQCFQHAKLILASVHDMEGHFGQLQNRIKGHLTISGPVSFSTLHLPPLLVAFKRQYPEVTIDLQLNDRKVDIVEEGFDLALRIGRLSNSSLVAKKIVPVRLVLCASPDYLKRNGVPLHPRDLHPEHFLHYSYMAYNQPGQPLLDMLKVYNQKKQSGLISNNGEILMAAAIAGDGYVIQPTFIVGDAIRQGKLRAVLGEFEPDPMGLYAVFPHRKLLAPKLRAFIDFIGSYYGDPPYWDNF